MATGYFHPTRPAAPHVVPSWAVLRTVAADPPSLAAVLRLRTRKLRVPLEMCSRIFNIGMFRHVAYSIPRGPR